MDLVNNRPLIISCGIGGWYGAGIDRLERSLIWAGFGGDVLLLKDYPFGCPNHEENPYAFKVHLFREAFNRGYKNVMWLDASFWCVKTPMPMFDYVQDNGLYFFKSGYPLSATATDRLLNWESEKREDLVDVPEFATGCVGINIDNPLGNEFFNRWLLYCDNMLFQGNRVHDENDSTHPLFKFSRQDQSAASMALHKMGITNFNAPNWIAYHGTNYIENELIWFIGGL